MNRQCMGDWKPGRERMTAETTKSNDRSYKYLRTSFSFVIQCIRLSKRVSDRVSERVSNKVEETKYQARQSAMLSIGDSLSDDVCVNRRTLVLLAPTSSGLFYDRTFIVCVRSTPLANLGRVWREVALSLLSDWTSVSEASHASARPLFIQTTTPPPLHTKYQRAHKKAIYLIIQFSFFLLPCQIGSFFMINLCLVVSIRNTNSVIL